MVNLIIVDLFVGKQQVGGIFVEWMVYCLIRIDQIGIQMGKNIVLYKFYMQAQSSCITKTFELVDQYSGQLNTYSIQVPYLPSSRQINISQAILSICALGLNLNNCHLFYLDFSRKLYVHIGQFPFKQVVYLKYELFLDSAIKIRYRNISSDAKSQKSSGAPNSKPQKKVKERTIREANEFVNYWRQLYEMVDQKGKRIYTLETAAAKVGLAKKTLDDYYYQLRQAQYYGFDFQNHRDDKIGVLRRFVKQAIKNESEGRLKAEEDDIDRYLASSSDSEEERRYK